MKPDLSCCPPWPSAQATPPPRPAWSRPRHGDGWAHNTAGSDATKPEEIGRYVCMHMPSEEPQLPRGNSRTCSAAIDLVPRMRVSAHRPHQPARHRESVEKLMQSLGFALGAPSERLRVRWSLVGPADQEAHVMSSGGSATTRPCPSCAEPILLATKKC
jgi:hypothetical protein